MFRKLLTQDDVLHLPQEALALTANQRLAVVLKRRHAKAMKAAGHKTWASPRCYPLNSWIESLFLAAHPHRTLITPHMEAELWRQIIDSDPETPALLQPSSLVQQLQAAWQLLTLWHVPRAYLDAPESIEFACFQRWLQRFEGICQEQALITNAELPEWVGKHVFDSLGPDLRRDDGEKKNRDDGGRRRLETDPGSRTLKIEKIILMGFDDLSPAHQALLKTLETHTPIEEWSFEIPDADCSHIRLQNTQDEILQMARWAKHQLDNDVAHITCVVPDLNSLRDEIAWRFQETLSPETFYLQDTPRAPAPRFNISAAKKLIRYPLIQAALDTLLFSQQAIPLEQAHRFFQSPYLCQSDIDIHCAAQLDLALRETQAPEVPHALVFNALNRINSDYPNNSWVSRWRDYTQLARSISTQKKRLPEWVTHFNALLDALAWPSGRELSSLEYQLHQRFEELLLEFAKIDFLYPPCTLKVALNHFKRFISGIEFQPEGSIAPIQILGLLESAGNCSDALWVMQTDDDHWPTSADPNPFIPYALQRELGLPRATPEREARYSQALQERLAKSAKKVIFSSPQFQDNRPCLPSTAMAALPTTTLSALGVPENSMETLKTTHLEHIADDHVQITTTANTTGGSAVIKMQSLCPFQAFAKHRLRVAALQTSVTGISPQERGTWTHLALLSIWKQLKNHSTLLSLTRSHLTELVANSIEQTQPPFRYREDRYYLTLERKRLETLLVAWLDFEKTREPFDVIAQEKNETVQVGPLKLRIQVDRIDQNAKGEQLIIDYKTGKNSPAVWKGERPKDPQLPLYCTFIEDATQVHGIAFAEIRAGSTKLIGYSSKSDEQWSEQVTQWRETLVALANAFASGDARVDPIDTQVACTYCDLQSLCRIGETLT